MNGTMKTAWLFINAGLIVWPPGLPESTVIKQRLLHCLTALNTVKDITGSCACTHRNSWIISMFLRLTLKPTKALPILSSNTGLNSETESKFGQWRFTANPTIESLWLMRATPHCYPLSCIVNSTMFFNQFTQSVLKLIRDTKVDKSRLRKSLSCATIWVTWVSTKWGL